MEPVKRVRVVASGAVQGVFFRDSTEREARRLGLTGWVTNRPDGRVEAEFQGPPNAVDEAVAFCRRGPGRARVDDLAVEEVGLEDTESGFEVR
jgi:acylphosphatase